MYEAGEGRYEGGWVSELEVREKGLTELGRREEGGIHMRKKPKITVSFFTLKK